MKDLKIDAIAFRSSGWWVAQCLQYDIATQTKVFEDIPYELAKMLVGHMLIAKAHNLEPFEHLPPAPRKYWELFSRGS